MARYTEAVCRLCRREGMKLYLKGDRCYSDKCGVTRRPQAPGQHGTGRRKLSEYGLQLREKQKARRIYGVLEKQFANYFVKAEKMKGITGENLLQLLERRLDNVVYRLGFAQSRPQARQLVRHGHITVNGRKVNIPSFLVDLDDIVAVKAKSASEVEHFKLLKEGTGRTVAPWLEVNYEALEAKVVSLPSREDIDVEIQEHLIVEYYSH
ncbi:MAG: 30S ribosomal protein S4 [Caldicoprobacterales bacterium]|jgi:small subunit ribosomal protein S4|nr:30S ribosomal protein S4 [Clostridia bacterium]MDI9511519.1 30S ribosomal protein S4 [Bacillota bacterium]NLH58319.1 30S ribosomal protein S4 [Clostridiales bacterium]